MPSFRTPNAVFAPALSPGPGCQVSRRAFVAGGMVAPLVALATPIAGGCAAIIGEETFEAFFVIPAGGNGTFWGWTEVELDTAAEADDAAILKRALLRAPAGVTDLRFLTSVLGEAVMPSGERTALAQGADFPENDTMGPLEILYDDNLRRFFQGGKKIRIEWTGTYDTTYPFPAEGLRVDALVVVEVL